MACRTAVRPACCAIDFSCLGAPSATYSNVGRLSSISRMTSRLCARSARNPRGGETKCPQPSDWESAEQKPLQFAQPYQEVLLLAAAQLLTHVRFRIAGDGPERPRLERDAPPNVAFEGLLKGDRLVSLNREAAMVTIPSVTFEPAPMVALESPARSIPVVASRIGALPEVVEERETGVLAEPNDSLGLADAIDELWSNRNLAKEVGRVGRELIKENYSSVNLSSRSVAAYELAIDRHTRML